ncbi:MAG TPA: SHOCT domain-containing protein [Gammaproteobacteria bacterium]|nr:SHOCT domain-containing protein [Gammaproteobacteria bacterium]
MYDGYGWHGYGMGYDPFWWVFMVLIWLVLIVGIAAIVKSLFFSSHSAAGSGHESKTAVQILEERYARGEIGKEEFEQKRKDLRA